MTWKPFSPPPEPRRLGRSLDRITRSLGAPSAGALATIFERWPAIVGEAVAAHSRPLSLQRGTLTVGADQPAWAAQLSYLEDDMKRRVNGVVGTAVVTRVRVVVRQK